LFDQKVWIGVDKNLGWILMPISWIVAVRNQDVEFVSRFQMLGMRINNDFQVMCLLA